MSNELKRFEVSIYNQQVREMDRENKDHPNFSCDWAHLHFLTYEGEAEYDVIQMVHKTRGPAVLEIYYFIGSHTEFYP